MRIAVVGSRGQLGAAVVQELSATHEVRALDRRALDVTDPNAVAACFRHDPADVIINCTGFNMVDAAEERPGEALAVNAFAVRLLARAAAAGDARFVHYSSDFVFDGKLPRPLTEEDPPNPQSAYATSKLLGEWFAADAPQSYVLRVESLFDGVPGVPAKGTVAGIVNTIRGGGTPKVLRDRTVSPTSVIDAAVATRRLLEGTAPFGVYHCVNSGLCTWLEFAEEVARLLRVAPRFDVLDFVSMKLPAVRPQYCALSNRKLAAAGAPMPTWQDALARYVASQSTPSE